MHMDVQVSQLAFKFWVGLCVRNPHFKITKIENKYENSYIQSFQRLTMLWESVAFTC